MKKIFVFSMAVAAGLMLSNCKGGKKSGSSENTVYAHALSDPDMLNPINTSSADGREASNYIFGALAGTDADNYSVIPTFIKERPVMTPIEEGPLKGGMKLDFELREEAAWDNGTPMTGHDYAFTLKAILNPKTNCQPLKPYFDWLYDVVVDSTNPKKFTVYSKEKYFKIEETASGYILPEYAYDPNQVMRKFAIQDLNSDEKRNKLKENADIQAFANEFNSEKHMREKGGIVGAGPYEFEEWVTGQKIVLKKKKNWWGDKLKDNRAFYAFPEKIVFKVINDPATTLTALKDGQLDCEHGVQPKPFEELLKNEKFKEKYRVENPSIFAYTFIGFNIKNKKLDDVRVREAFAHCINKKQINETINFNKNTLVETFVHPQQKHYVDLPAFEYNLDKARQLLDEAGWKDSDGDGIRDKVIKGEKVKLSLEYKVNTNESRKNTGLLIKEDLKKVGIDLTIVTREWAVYLQDLDKKEFEITYGSFTMSPTMSDPKQQWHTSSAVEGGSNNTQWGNAQSDKLIDDLRAELDENKRVEMYKQLQTMIHKDIPCVFMFIPANRMAISKRFDVKTTMLDPGFQLSEFKLVQSGK